MKTHGAIDEIVLLIQSGYPFIYLLTKEEERSREMIRKAADYAGYAFVETAPAADRASAAGELESAISGGDHTVYYIPDLHFHLDDPGVSRRIKELASISRRFSKCIAVAAPRLNAPPELDQEIAVVNIPLPTREELNEVYEQAAQEDGNLPQDDAMRNSFVKAAQGLALEEARRVFRKAAASSMGIDLVINEKKKALRRTDGLEFRELSETLDDVGGLDSLKKWLEERTRAFSDDARKFGLPEPRGLFLTGVQGCGKSLVSKAVAGFWRMPLVRLDLAAVFGASRPEEILSSSLAVAEAMAPCVLWIDEVEKGFDATEGGGASRVLGVMVTWLQEKTAPVFTIATSNRVDRLPPEFPRKGRFDDIFFVDLPQVHERRDILSLHISKRGRDPSKFDLDSLAKKAERFTGSEIEQAVVSALYTAFSRNRELEQADVMNALSDTVPLADTFDEEIKRLREWALKRARHASTDRKRLDYFKE